MPPAVFGRNTDSAGPAYPEDRSSRTLCARTTVLTVFRLTRTPMVVTRGSGFGGRHTPKFGGCCRGGGEVFWCTFHLSKINLIFNLLNLLLSLFFSVFFLDISVAMVWWCSPTSRGWGNLAYSHTTNDRGTTSSENTVCLYTADPLSLVMF